jgi:hypothetical protein
MGSTDTAEAAKVQVESLTVDTFAVVAKVLAQETPQCGLGREVERVGSLTYSGMPGSNYIVIEMA